MMTLISCRYGFDNAAHFGPHITREGAVLTYGYPRALGGTILVHGYNSSEQAAEKGYQDLQALLPEVPMTGYLWPGEDVGLEYPLAVDNATECGPRLRDLLNGCGDMSNIDIQTHSLGARVALEALKYAGGVRIRHLILSAPAVNHDALEPGGEFAGALDNCVSLNIFYSANDPVLKCDYPLGSFGHQALGLLGPVSLRPRMRAFDCSAVVHAHGQYRYQPQYAAAWRAILDGSAAPGLTVVKST